MLDENVLLPLDLTCGSLLSLMLTWNKTCYGQITRDSCFFWKMADVLCMNSTVDCIQICSQTKSHAVVFATISKPWACVFFFSPDFVGVLNASPISNVLSKIFFFFCTLDIIQLPSFLIKCVWGNCDSITTHLGRPQLRLHKFNSPDSVQRQRCFYYLQQSMPKLSGQTESRKEENCLHCDVQWTDHLKMSGVWLANLNEEFPQ